VKQKGDSGDWKEFLGLTVGEGLDKGIIKQVVKRNGQVVPYDRNIIANAIRKSAMATGIKDAELFVQKQTGIVEIKLENVMSKRHPNSAPAVEEIQDIVENILIASDHPELAKN